MTEACAKILLVDDDLQTRLKLTRYLQAKGHAVSAIDSGQAALEALSTETYDLILLDLLMPEMDGFEVLRKLKADAQLSDIPVIVVSALEDSQGEVKSKQLGAQAYMSKPVDGDILNALVVECLNLGK